MKVEVRYYSRSGNTKKLADAIASSLKTVAKTTDEAMKNTIDILFLGGSVYAGNMDKKLKDFLETLDNTKVKKVAVFSTSASGKSIYQKVKDILDKKNIEVLEKSFSCKGKFLFSNRNRPNDQDMKDVVAFAKEVLK